MYCIINYLFDIVFDNEFSFIGYMLIYFKYIYYDYGYI